MMLGKRSEVQWGEEWEKKRNEEREEERGRERKSHLAAKRED